MSETDNTGTLPPRDIALGAALRALPVPGHADGFYEAVEALLATTDAAAAAGAAATADPVPLSLVGRRQGWRRRTLRAAVVAAAAGVIGVAIGVNLDRSASPVRSDPPAVAIDAVRVAQRMRTALSSVRTLSGTIVFRDQEGEVRSRFAVTADGDFRQSGITRREELAYDSRTGVERGYFVDPSGPGYGAERTGLSPGRPDGGPANWILRRELGSTVRAIAAEDSSTTVEETTHDGRPAWLLATDVEPNHISGGGDRIVVTVDQATGFPVRVEETIAGAPYREVLLEGLVTDAPVERSEFTVEFPAGVKVSRVNEGWRRHATLDEVGDAVGYRALVPAPGAVPDGFVLQQITTARTAQGTGVEGMNPPTIDAVSLAFHRGLDQIVVTMRRRGGIVAGREPGSLPEQCNECLGDSSWSDPLASGEGFVDRPENLVVRAGALAGAQAQMLIAPRAVPHVWALGEELVVTVSGDATRAELLAIVESMEPHSR